MCRFYINTGRGPLLDVLDLLMEQAAESFLCGVRFGTKKGTEMFRPPLFYKSIWHKAQFNMSRNDSFRYPSNRLNRIDNESRLQKKLGYAGGKYECSQE